MRHLPKLILLLLVFAVAHPGAAAPVAPAAPAESAHGSRLPFVGQRALYTLSLASPRGTSVVAGSGRMGFEVLDACDGWAVRQRLAMTLINAEGGVTHTLSDYATWEAKDGLTFRFHTSDMTNGEVTDRLAGVAHLVRPGGPGEVTYSEPHHAKLALPAGTLFPMAQTEAIILAARAGKKFIATPLFDGTDATGASWSSVAIEGWNPPAAHGAASRFPALAGMPNTRVRVAFFSGGQADMLPDFEIGMRYFLNGVADGLEMDFANFSMRGKLVDLSILPSHC